MRYYIVDAFTERHFGGNPAGVCLPGAELDEELMQSIAAENNLAETAFVVPAGNGYWLRWFTPDTEIDLCGHATLASAYVLSHFVDTAAREFRFDTMSGILTVIREGERYVMDFPSRKPVRTEVTAAMRSFIDVPVLEAHRSRDLMLVVADEREIRELKPNYNAMGEDGGFAVIVTAAGDSADFVSRFFAPGAGIPEDPVTGSSHTTLIPFWSERLGRAVMTAKQLSRRGGILYCEDRGERVRIAGAAALYLTGEIHL